MRRRLVRSPRRGILVTERDNVLATSEKCLGDIEPDKARAPSQQDRHAIAHC